MKIQSIYVLVIILLTELSNSVDSAKAYPAECPDVTLPQELDLVKLQGKWFDWKVMKGGYFTCGVHFIDVAHIDNEPNLLNITSYVLLSNGSDVVETGLYRKEATTRPLGYTLTSTDMWFHYMDGYILETDYDTYGVTLNCDDHFGKLVETVWIMSKTKDFPKEVGDKAMQVIERNKINIDMIDVVDMCTDYYAPY